MLRPNSQYNKIAVLNLGGQYCHMIGRRLRDIGVYSDILEYTVSEDRLKDYAGIILSGGPQSVNAKGAPRVTPNLLDLKRPILGICYGHQLLAQMAGSRIASGFGEYGKARLRLTTENPLFGGTPEEQTVWMSHSDSVSALPIGFDALADTATCEVAAFADMGRNIFGVQFHPEVGHTEFGTKVLTNFSREICGIRLRDRISSRVEHLISDIRTRVGSKSVVFFVSGGVDSTVAFTLCARALPPGQVLGVYVDTGLMRKNETEELGDLLEAAGLREQLRIRRESDRFLNVLRDECDPERKRKLVGRLFIDVQRDALKDYGIDTDDWLLGQGTIYPDTVESGGASTTTALIKTHHNRCDEVRALIEQGKVIEPLSEFYKDEVRQIGEQLGLDKRLTGRWPFPGPGLAIRCLCVEGGEKPVTPINLLHPHEQYEAVRFPIRSVGVQGDGRTYSDIVAVRGVLDYDALSNISVSLCNSGDYNRVIAYVAGLAPSLSSGVVKARSLTSERLEVLRSADAAARRIMDSHGLTNEVWQFPVVLVPVSFGGGESIVLRPVHSTDGMTADYARLSPPVIEEIGEEIMCIEGIDAVFLDVTDKPPATIEWE